MLRVITEDQNIWDGIVKSFQNWDIYYLYHYCKLLEEHGDGTPALIYFESDSFRLCYAVMKSDISDDPRFHGALKKETLYDFSTPYGYGGPLLEGIPDDRVLAGFFRELTGYCNENNIVSQFIRFHPMLCNDKVFRDYSEVRTIKKTVMINSVSDEVIFSNMTDKNRNMIRKAKRNEIVIEADKGEQIDKFIEIYNKTMDRNNADRYYYFSDDYFRSFTDRLNDNCMIFYAKLGSEVIGASMLLYNEKYMHYHLSGAEREYMSLAPTNYLIYSMALWGAERGIALFHLGGGIENEDSLFSFKKSFNKNGMLDFSIGRNVFIPERYNDLIQLRKKIDPEFNENNNRLIQYRG